MGARLGFVATLVAVSLAGAACGDENPNTSTFELTGKVTDRATGDGIGSATVLFVSDTLFESSTRTGGGGSYEMTVVSDSPFGQVRAEKDGWLSDEKTVFFDTRTRRIDLGLRRLEE